MPKAKTWANRGLHVPVYSNRLARLLVSKTVLAAFVISLSAMNHGKAEDESSLHKCSKIMGAMITSPLGWEIVKNRGFRYENLPNSNNFKYRVICKGDPSDSDPDVVIPKRPKCSPIGLEMIDVKNGTIYGLSDPRAFQDEGFLREKKIRFQFQGKKWVMDTFKTDHDYFKLALAKEVKNSNWPEMTLRPTVNSRKDFFEVNTEYLFKNHKTSIIEFLRLSNVCDCAKPYPNLVLYAGMSQAANISLGQYCKLTPLKRQEYQTRLEVYFDKVVSRTPPELGNGNTGSDLRDATSTLARDTGNVVKSDANVDGDGDKQDDSGVSASADAGGVSSNAYIDGVKALASVEDSDGGSNTSVPSGSSGSSLTKGDQAVASIPGKSSGSSNDAKLGNAGDGTRKDESAKSTGNETSNDKSKSSSPKEAFDPDENEQAPKDPNKPLEGKTSEDGLKTDTDAIGSKSANSGTGDVKPAPTDGKLTVGPTGGLSGDVNGAKVDGANSNSSDKAESAAAKGESDGAESNQVQQGGRPSQPGEVSRQSAGDPNEGQFGHDPNAEIENILNSMCPSCIDETIAFQGIGRGKCVPGDVEKINLVTGPDGGNQLFCDKDKRFVNPYVLEQIKETIKSSTCRMYLYASTMVDTVTFTRANIEGTLDTDGKVSDEIKAAFDIVKTSLVFALNEIPACRKQGDFTPANIAFASLETLARKIHGQGDDLSFQSALEATSGIAAASVEAAKRVLKQEGDLPILAKSYCSIVTP